MAVLLAKEGVKFDDREVLDPLVCSDSKTADKLVHLAKGKLVMFDSEVSQDNKVKER